MFKEKNEIHINELDSIKSNTFLQDFEDVINKSVQYFINRGMIYEYYKDDFVQNVNEKLLIKLPKIKESFNAKSTFRTYLITVIRNICRDEIRKNSKEELKVELNEEIREGESLSPEESLVIQQEVKRLNLILNTYPKSVNKINLCLKFKFRIPFFKLDFVKYNKSIKNSEYVTLKKILSKYPNVTDGLIYKTLISLFNKYENTSNTPDALRKWIKQKVDEIIHLLNSGGVSKHNEESLQILFEYYTASN